MQKTFKVTIGGETKKSRFASVVREIDWDKLPEAAKDFAAQYGLKQYLADGTVGEKVVNQATYIAAIDARIEKLKAGDFTRSKSDFGPTNDPATLARQMAKQIVIDAHKDNGKPLPAKERVQELADAYHAKNEAKLLADAEAQIKRRKDAAKDVDIDALLGLDSDGDETGDDDGDDAPEDEAAA